MPAKPEVFRQLSGLFTQYGVDGFLEFTTSLVTILDSNGRFLAWNLSLEKLKRSLTGAGHMRDFLSIPSQVLFDEFLKNTIQERVRKRSTIEFSGENRWGDFSCLFIPLPDERVLLIAEALFNISDLETITAELEKIKRSLAVKETELKAVLARAMRFPTPTR